MLFHVLYCKTDRCYRQNDEIEYHFNMGIGIFAVMVSYQVIEVENIYHYLEVLIQINKESE